MGPEQRAGSDLALHLVLPEQARDAFTELVGDRAAAADHLGEIDLDVADGDAVRGGVVADSADELAVLEQRLGRDAAPVEARAAKVFLLDAQDALLELPGADGGGVTAGAAADDHDVVLVAGGVGARGGCFRWSGCGALGGRGGLGGTFRSAACRLRL